MKGCKVSLTHHYAFIKCTCCECVCVLQSAVKWICQKTKDTFYLKNTTEAQRLLLLWGTKYDPVVQCTDKRGDPFLLKHFLFPLIQLSAVLDRSVLMYSLLAIALHMLQTCFLYTITAREQAGSTDEYSKQSDQSEFLLKIIGVSTY